MGHLSVVRHLFVVELLRPEVRTVRALTLDVLAPEVLTLGVLTLGVLAEGALVQLLELRFMPLLGMGGTLPLGREMGT